MFFDFLSRLRMPTFNQIFGVFLKSRSVTSALTTFNTTIEDLRCVANHHDEQAITKNDKIKALSLEVAAHNDEAKSADVIVGKLTALLV